MADNVRIHSVVMYDHNFNIIYDNNTLIYFMRLFDKDSILIKTYAFEIGITKQEAEFMIALINGDI